MDHPFKFGPNTSEAIVYIRAVPVTDLPQEVLDQLDGETDLYSVTRPDGERLALVKGRELAFAVARQNDLAPVSVH